MVGKSYEEKSISDICTEQFGDILNGIRRWRLYRLDTSLLEEVIYVRTGEVDYTINKKGEIKQESIRRGLSARLWFDILGINKLRDSKHYKHYLGQVDRELEGDCKFKGYRPSILMAARHQAGLLLKHLLTLDIERITFTDKLNKKDCCLVNKDLLENIIIPELGGALDIVHDRNHD